jgi:hypothetical protein
VAALGRPAAAGWRRAVAAATSWHLATGWRRAVAVWRPQRRPGVGLRRLSGGGFDGMASGCAGAEAEA